MFVNQIPAGKSQEIMEPDDPPIKEEYARSAILYGPPGSSKTTIVRALAEIIGWDYIELHASHFVADGLPNVQRTADEIFRKLMELDHAIILFDEIDELVREREAGSDPKGGPDAFGRFLTTSMLPKVAELWDSRKVLYFVATNHIEYFDRAITRGQRFDAVIFVGPSSFETKMEQLASILSKTYRKTFKFTVSKADVDRAIPEGKSDNDSESELPPGSILAKFVLLRWDELPELADHLNRNLDNGAPVDTEVFSQALGKVGDRRLTQLREYVRYLSAPKYARRDYGKLNVWILEGLGDKEMPPGTQRIGSRTVYPSPLSKATEIDIQGYVVTPLGRGKLRLRRKRSRRGKRRLQKRH